jgi:hypothetical protein
MAEWVQENRRAVVMLVVAMCVAVLAGLYLLMSGGGDPEDLPPVPRTAPADVAPVEDIGVEETDVDARSAVRVYTGRAANANPFGPIRGEDPNESQKGSETKTTGKPADSNKRLPREDPVTTTPRRDPGVKKPGSKDPRKPDEDRGPVAPQLIDKGKDADNALLVRVVAIEGDWLVVRIEGKRSRLFLGEPGAQGVTYVAALGGGCAWMQQAESEVRVSICQGEAERLPGPPASGEPALGG